MIDEIGKHFIAGTTVHGPNLLRFFDLNIIHHNDFTVTADGDDKINNLGTHPLSRVRRREFDSNLSVVVERRFSP